MKKLFVLLLVTGVFSLGFTNNMYAQEAEEDTTTTEQVAETAPAPETSVVENDEDTPVGDQTFHQVVKEQFLDGGWEFMSIVLACLILGLAIAIERIITLNLATTNTRKLLARVDEALAQDGVEGAKEICKNTRGPVASIFTQGLMRMSEGVEMVEKSIIAYGSVEMGRLERGLVWISLFISIAPMLGFMGTVIGMIGAFDNIAKANDIQPNIVADGIKVALLTTVGGLIVAVILQLFYNYCVSKIDSLVNQMEDASISLVDLLIKHNLSK
jgi:biopolymer transport protein ExbB